MPAILTTLLFWSALLAAVVAQLMILRSTRRVLRAVVPRSLSLEWAFALVPAVALAAVLLLSWRAAMRPPGVQVDLPVAPGMLRS